MTIATSLTHHAYALAFIMPLLGLVPPAFANDAGLCARSMVRLTYEYNTPPLTHRDPRTRLPSEMTVQQRRDLHYVLWPSEMSVRFTVRQWLAEKNFDCLEEAFADLEASQPRFPNGMLKQVGFLGGAREYVEVHRGMTEGEIANLMKEWRAKYPNSLLAEVMWSRMLMAAAWAVRGDGFADTVSPEKLVAFRRLNAAALKQLYALSDAAPKHVLGHYVALRGVSDNGATLEQLQRFSLEALRRFPREAPLGAFAADRLQPKWGGSTDLFEAFALEARKAVGAELADRTYAYLYTQVVTMDEWHNYPRVQIKLARAGLMDYANAGSFQEILALQEFACMQRDADVLRQAKSLWAKYAREPQLRPPVNELQGECRAWASTLSPTPSDADSTAHRAQPIAKVPNPSVVSPPSAQPPGVPVLFSVSPGPWTRLSTPIGEVYSCTVCEAPVQVLFTVGPLLGSDSPLATNEKFLDSIGTPLQQERMARDIVEGQPGMDRLKGTGAVQIERTGFGLLGGLRAFQYEARVKLQRVTMRETATVIVLKNRMLRVGINRAEGPVGSKEQQTVQALIDGVRLATD